ncbi:MAG TPA: PAS domain S-box protein, partial [Acidobacteriota bacterium]|nr:PAS domain S-box protein [Acidobacteriota bacterium]
MSPQKKIAPETRSPDAEPLIVALDVERIVCYVNPAGCLILGYPREEIVGQSWPARFVPRNDREAFQREFERWWKEGGPQEGQYPQFPLPTRGGGKRVLQWTAAPIPDASGNTTALLLTGEESPMQKQRIRKALNLSEVRLRAILDTVADGIITIDDRGRIESFNPAAEEIFGYTAEEVVGRNVSILMPEPDRSAHHRYLS